MTVLISGYLPSGNDESLKYEKTVPFEYISQVMEVMRWKKGENIEGEYPIKNDDVVRIEEVIGEKLPVGLEFFYWGLRLTIDCRGRSCCMGVLFKFKNILFGNRVLFLGLIVVKKESVTGKT
ncbi:pyocin S6 family toxin immunity protein [Pseudomonas aeruginosa]|uniref:pyocin S6 family toxin immunity protein n=4 Tax=Pseudomonas aeruginosa TaxID=287 RepID=UPI00398F6A2E